MAALYLLLEALTLLLIAPADSPFIPSCGLTYFTVGGSSWRGKAVAPSIILLSPSRFGLLWLPASHWAPNGVSRSGPAQTLLSRVRVPSWHTNAKHTLRALISPRCFSASIPSSGQVAGFVAASAPAGNISLVLTHPLGRKQCLSTVGLREPEQHPRGCLKSFLLFTPSGLLSLFLDFPVRQIPLSSKCDVIFKNFLHFTQHFYVFRVSLPLH